MKKLIAVLFVLILAASACNPITTDYSSTVESDYVYSTTYVAPEETESKTSSKVNKTSSAKKSNQKHTSSNKTSSKKDTSEPTWLGSDNKPQFEPYIPSGTVTYACYEALNSTQKQIYNKIDNAVNQMTDGLISLGECSERDMQVALYAVRMDRPEYFWVPTKYITELINGKERSIAFSYTSGEKSVSYTCTKQERTVMENKLKSKIAEIKKLVPQGASAYEIELILHDYVCKNVAYDVKAKENDNQKSYTAYGALVDGVAVCEGYARAMQLLLNQYSIPCRLVCGYAGEEHMWNLVKIGEKWHHLDATWDDPRTSDNSNVIMHYYFNISDDRIKDTHKMDVDFKKADEKALQNGSFNLSIPKCTSLEYFYGNVQNIVINDDVEKSIETIKRVLYTAASKGDATCEVYVDSKETKWEIVQNKYHLQECITEVNKQLSKKIKISSVVFDHATGRSLIFLLGYLK